MSGSTNSFGETVRALRAASGLTQAELAEAAGISERTVSDLERGLRTSVYPATARQLARALGVEHEELGGFLTSARGSTAHSAAATGPGEVLSDRRSRVPVPLTRLLGREAEVAATLGLVGDRDTRLVTVVGPGGIGKSRLAMEVAALAQDDFADGCYFVNLSGVDDPAIVLPQIATAMGLPPVSGEAPALLAARLARSQALVVLDSVEHVLASGPSIGELLASSPGLKVLATSQAPLHLRGEHVLQLLPLAVDAEGAELAPAVALFIERAAAVDPGFRTDPQTAATVALVCGRLEGVPLAIELAAARVRHVPIAELRIQLQHRLDSLVGGARDLPPRQRTMRGTLDWSYALLAAPEMRLFRCLAPFRGGFGRDAAVAIARSTTGTEDDAIESLDTLLDSSLVLRAGTPSDEARYRLLDVTRDYAVERATSAGEVEGLRRRHAEYFVALAERAEPELRGARQRQWHQRLLDDEANFRAALGWALAAGESGPALRLAGSLWMFWRWAGLFAEGRRWLDAALAMGKETDIAIRCQGFWGAGWLAFHQGDYGRTGEIGQQMLRALGAEGDPLLRRNGFTLLGNAALGEGRQEDAIGALTEALVLAQSSPNSWHAAASRLNVGTAQLPAGLVTEARESFEGALAIFESLGDQHFTARALVHLGYCDLLDGDVPAAVERVDRAVGIVGGLGDGWSIAEGLEAAAAVRSSSDARTAAVLGGAAEVLRERISMQQHPAAAVVNRLCLERARRKLEPQEFEAAWVDGRAMAVEEALQVAMNRP